MYACRWARCRQERREMERIGGAGGGKRRGERQLMLSVWLGEDQETKRGFVCLLLLLDHQILFSFLLFVLPSRFLSLAFCHRLSLSPLSTHTTSSSSRRFWFGFSFYRFPLYLFSSLFPSSWFVWFSLPFCLCKRDEDK